ncbi:MAG TPA: hypothetical protein VMR90_09540 [Candidatus Cybelea sp.]|nr:hypothetical protein [Candidatus Cybelea sp.]
MNAKRFALAITVLWFLCAQNLSAQVDESPNPAASPPNMLVLVHQEFRFGKEGERQKLAALMARACDPLNVPNDWIDLEAISGSPESLSFDPFDSFEQVDAAFAGWPRIFAAHPELARTQEEYNALLVGERTIIAVRRDDLGFRPQAIDFSKARFLRVLEVRLNPGHERDFVEAFRILGGAYERIKATTPWVVYQVNVGIPSPSFLVFMPLRDLRQNDDLLNWRKDIREAEGEDAASQMEQIAREAYAATESNLYAINPGASRVSKDFADGDPAFWSPKPSASKPAPRKEAEAKPKP